LTKLVIGWVVPRETTTPRRGTPFAERSQGGACLIPSYRIVVALRTARGNCWHRSSQLRSERPILCALPNAACPVRFGCTIRARGYRVEGLCLLERFDGEPPVPIRSNPPGLTNLCLHG